MGNILEQFFQNVNVFLACRDGFWQYIHFPVFNGEGEKIFVCSFIKERCFLTRFFIGDKGVKVSLHHEFFNLIRSISRSI